MSYDRAGQGLVADPANPKSIPVAKPDNAALMRADQRAINAEDKAFSRMRPEQKITKTDWRVG